MFGEVKGREHEICPVSSSVKKLNMCQPPLYSSFSGSPNFTKKQKTFLLLSLLLSLPPSD